MDSFEVARAAGLATSQDAWSVQRLIMDYLEGHWSDPDNGLWEMRGDRRRFTHSKVMTWVAVDRAIRGVNEWKLDGPLDRWTSLRDEIRNDVLANGFDADLNSFVQSYGSTELDAALLLVPAVGFLPGDDPRVIGTVEAIQEHLQVDGFVRRYLTDEDTGPDGLSGEEATFIVCTFWLADALCLAGRCDEARQTFERILTLRNDLGLLSEEYDARKQRLIGNVPQAYSHVGVVNTARNLSQQGGPAHHRSRSKVKHSS
jgi:GH15 family glucan-1,4-alpha-glucosidase